MINVMMVEDDLELANILTEYLAGFNIKITNFDSPYEALIRINSGKYELLILDLTLPDMDGIELCKKVREKTDIPIIVSSARTDITDKVLALKFGADDYIPKPYDPRELEARIISNVRRAQNSIESDEKNEQKNSGAFQIVDDEYAIKFNGETLNLTKAEYEILSFLIKRNNYVVSRENIIQNASSIKEDSSDKSIDVIISRIRQKLNEDSKNPKYIHSIRGIGYKFMM